MIVSRRDQCQVDNDNVGVQLRNARGENHGNLRTNSAGDSVKLVVFPVQELPSA